MSNKNNSTIKCRHNRNVIVVIGDWFIDENWLVAPRKTYSSSHTGENHFLSKHTEVDKRMISLCGAPEIMAVLKEYFDLKEKENDYSELLKKEEIKFVGFGVWNRKDEDILQCTVCPYNTRDKYLTPYTIKSLEDVKKVGDEQTRICPYLNGQECKYEFELHNLAPEEDEHSSTNRIIRCYEGYGGSTPRLLYRFDWELQIKSKLNYHPLDIFRQNDLRISDINETVRAVIIEDHGKGVITEETIEALINKLKNPKDIKWYVRTKLNRPSWFKIFSDRKIKLRMRVIDFKLATHRKGQRRWAHGKELGRASLELLGDLTGVEVTTYGEKQKMNLECDRGAVIFAENTAIAKDGNSCFNLHKSLGPRQYINIGRTTMFFNALIAQDLEEHALLEWKDITSKSESNFGIQCHKALNCAYEWSKEASDAWSKEKIQFYGEYSDALKPLHSPHLSADVKRENYSTLMKKWEESSKECGTLNLKVDKREKEIFQAWRGIGVLDDYICVSDQKRKEINDLLTKIHNFNSEKTPKHPFNCLLYSSPGWGKSYLAKSLAKKFDMLYLPFSLSQMANNNDLIDCFDSICSMQNVTDKKVLIFMDEINCEIEGHAAMGLLLSPIWDGVFLREGRTYTIQPAVWIFASTGKLSDIAISDVNKGSDFLSRLNGPIIELNALYDKNNNSLNDQVEKAKKDIMSNLSTLSQDAEKYQNIFTSFQGQFRTEQVYLAINMLNRHEPISSIQKEVINLFHDLFPMNGFRSLEFFISKFSNIERGIVTSANVPTNDEYKELNRHIVLPEQWRKKETSPAEDLQNLVSIETVVT